MHRQSHPAPRGTALAAIRAGISALVIAALLANSASTASAAIKRIPVTQDRAFRLLEQCLLDGGGDHRNDHQLPMFCCATGDSGANYCISCYGGTPEDPKNCEVSAKARVTAGGRIQTEAPGSGTVAPAPEPRGRPGLGTLGRLKRLSPAIVAPNN